MFYVYGVSGQSFRGSMEQLRQIARPGASARTDPVKPVKRDGSDPAYAEAQTDAGEPIPPRPLTRLTAPR